MKNLNKILICLSVIIAIFIITMSVYFSANNKQRILENQIKCQTLIKDLKASYSNTRGIYFSEKANTCIVRYSKNGVDLEKSIQDIGNGL